MTVYFDAVSERCVLGGGQDGSCNGLQHYAALARDQAGAESVNLSPFSVPKDVYSDVVEKVASHCTTQISWQYCEVITL